jgi:hypothetical protein
MSFKMHANTLPKSFSPLSIAYNGIQQYIQLVAIKLNFFFGGKISSFSSTGVLSQRSHGREFVHASITSRARDQDAPLPIEAKLQASLGTCNASSRSRWVLLKFIDRVRPLVSPTQPPTQWPLGMLLRGYP